SRSCGEGEGVAFPFAPGGRGRTVRRRPRPGRSAPGQRRATLPGRDLWSFGRLRRTVWASPAGPLTRARAGPAGRTEAAGSQENSSVHLATPDTMNGHRDPASSPPTHVVIPSDPAEARRVQGDIEQLLQQHRYSERDVFSIKLALEEALVNAI